MTKPDFHYVECAQCARLIVDSGEDESFCPECTALLEEAYRADQAEARVEALEKELGELRSSARGSLCGVHRDLWRESESCAGCAISRYHAQVGELEEKLRDAEERAEFLNTEHDSAWAERADALEKLAKAEERLGRGPVAVYRARQEWCRSCLGLESAVAVCDACRGTGLHVTTAPRDVALALSWLLVRVGSWTSSSWRSHVRHEFGDEVGDRVESWIAAAGLSPVGIGQMTESEFESARLAVRDLPPGPETVDDRARETPREGGIKP